MEPMSEVIYEEVSITRKMYGWSKYGGARRGIVKEELPEWACQLCGARNTSGLPAYFVPQDKYQREFMRVCSICKKASIELRMQTFDEMLQAKLANLLTLPTRYNHGKED